MTGVKHVSHLAVRVYAIWGALLVLLFLPAAVARMGRTRVQPVLFDSTPHGNGQVMGTWTADGRRELWAHVSIAGGPWVPAGGVVVCRTLAYLPAGTPVACRTAGGVEMRTSIREAPASTARLSTSATLALLALVLSVAGVGLAVSGVTRAAVVAGAALAGLGHLSGAFLLEPNVSLLADGPSRLAVVLAWSTFPRHLAFFWLASFLSLFPTDESASLAARLSRRVTAALAAAQWGLVVLFLLPGVLERLDFPLQAVFVGTTWLLARASFAAGLAAAAVLVLRQVRAFRRGALPSGTRRRAEVVGVGLLAGIGPPLVLALVQILHVVARGRPLIPSAVMSLAFLPMLLVPAVLAYAMLAPRVLSVGILVRKAVFLAFAERTVRVASFLPLAALALILYHQRERRLGEILADHPFLIGLAVVATVAGLRYGERTRPFLARLFFRARGSSPRAVARITEEIRQAHDVGDLAERLSTGVEQVLGVELAAVFVRSDGSGSFSSPGRTLPSLDASSPVLEAAEASPGPFRVDQDEGNELWRGLSELDRNWLDSMRTQLLVPLKGADRRLLGVLAVGEKLSELPLDAEDEHFLSAAASSGALALENLLLRSTHPSSIGRSGGEEDSSRDAAVPPRSALSCPRCSRILPPSVGTTCPDDETPLEAAPVPQLLSGKYRFERRIGAGGMGVVYLARDLALARDVAIKTLPSLSAGSARRLQREARAAALLVHPNLGLIFSSESWRGTPMLVLEYLAGGTLAARIRGGRVGPSLAVAWGAALASGLEAIHARRVLHRDIKPSNVGFTAEGVPKLLDFGLVRLIGDAEAAAPPGAIPEAADETGDGTRSPLTSASRVVGTVPYLSPEAIQGHAPSESFDLWGLSVTIYETVTGTNPFASSSAARTAERILTSAAPDPREFRPNCPEPVATFLLSALARSAQARPASARALREALESLGRTLAPEDPPGTAQPASRTPSDLELLRTPTIDP